MRSNTINAKKLKTQQKVVSYQQLNDRIIEKYGSFHELKVQRTLFSRTRCNTYRAAHNDYHSYTRRKKFIENNFETVPLRYYQSTDVTNISIRLEEGNSGVSDELLCRQQHTRSQEDTENGEDTDNISNNSERTEQSLENNSSSDETLCLIDSARRPREQDSENLCCSNCHPGDNTMI